jgi:hypothetical protein
VWRRHSLSVHLGPIENPWGAFSLDGRHLGTQDSEGFVRLSMLTTSRSKIQHITLYVQAQHYATPLANKASALFQMTTWVFMNHGNAIVVCVFNCPVSASRIRGHSRVLNGFRNHLISIGLHLPIRLVKGRSRRFETKAWVG